MPEDLKIRTAKAYQNLLIKDLILSRLILLIMFNVVFYYVYVSIIK